MQLQSSTFGPPVDSAYFWSHPERVPISGNPDEDTATTLRIMGTQGHVGNAVKDWLVNETAQQAVSMFAGLAGGRDARAIAEACWWWCKVHIKFVHHESILRRRLGEAGHLQGLISPEVLVRMDQPEGDCAIFSECLGAFLTVHGIPFEFVTVAASKAEPEEYSHVFIYAVMPDGRRFPLDASHGDYAGWQVPSAAVFRRQVWSSDGYPVPDRGSRFDGLHGYGLRGREDANDLATQPFLGMGRLMGIARGLRGGDGGEGGYGRMYDANDFANSPYSGMGRLRGMDDANDFAVSAWMGMGDLVCLDPNDPSSCSQSDGSSSADLCSLYPAMCAGSSGTTADGGSGPIATTSITVPTQASSAWPAFAAQLMKSGLTLAEIQSIPAGTIVNPSGQIIRQSPGYALPGTGLPATVGSFSTTTLLLIAGVVIGFPMLMSMGRR